MTRDDGLTDTERDAIAYQTTRIQGDSLRTINAMIHMAAREARQRRSADASRSRLLDNYRMLIGAARSEGRIQVLIIAGVRHAIRAGGIQGHPLAPVTIYEYLRVGALLLLERLQRCDPESFTADEWAVIYDEVTERTAPTQRGKLGAFLEAVHRFAVIAGCAPLNRSIARKGRPLPPAAAIVWPHEMESTLEYVARSQALQSVKRQAILVLQLAYVVPLRIQELWCIRVGDITETNAGIVLAIYPRRRDGLCKAVSTRRQVDIRDAAVMALLLDQRSLRHAQSAQDEDVLLGEPGMPDARHEEELTTTLLNVALKHGCSNAEASFHDLRHSCISMACRSELLK